MRRIRHIKGKVNALKARLLGKPVVENFGENEQRRLDDFIGDIWEYPYEKRNTIFALKNEFVEWCANYTGGPRDYATRRAGRPATGR